MQDNNILQALENNLWEVWSYFGRGPNCALHNEGDALWFDTPVPSLPYNGVLRFIVFNEVNNRIDSIMEHYRERQASYLWMVHPSSMPNDLSKRLQERGLKETEHISGMAANLDELPESPPLPQGFEVHEVYNETETHKMLEFVAWRWHVPEEARPYLFSFYQVFHLGKPSAKIRCWLACHEGLPVSKVILHCAHGTAGIYGVATKPEARGKGLAVILTLQALKAARKAGYKLGVLHSTSMAQNLYARLGFHHIAPYRIFASETMHI